MLFTLDAAFVIRANIPITIDKAATAPARLAGSIIESAATAAAIIPIATVMTIKFPLQFLASFVACIINAITEPRIPIAITPFANPAKSIKLSKIAIPARIAMETDIAKIVAAIFGASFPSFLTIEVSNAITPTNPNIAR